MFQVKPVGISLLLNPLESCRIQHIWCFPRNLPGQRADVDVCQTLTDEDCRYLHTSVTRYQWTFRKLTTMGTPKLSTEGAKLEAPTIEHRRRENRSAEGAEWGGIWGGVSPPQPTRRSGEAS